MDNFVTDLLSRIDQIGSGFSARAYGIVGSEIMPTLKVALVLYVALYGLQLILGTSNVSVGEFISRTVRFILILTFTQNWQVFNDLFYSWLSVAPEAAGKAILTATNTGISDPTNGLSMVVATASNAASALAKQSGYFTILPSMLGLLIMCCAYVVVAVAMAILIISKVAMWLLVATAPIFIACLLFEKTRSLGTSWFSQVLLYSIIPLFVYVITAFLIAALNPELSKIEVAIASDVLSLTHIASFVLLSIAGIFMLVSVQSLAQGIAGGFGANVGGTGRTAGRLLMNAPFAAVRTLASLTGNGDDTTKPTSGGSISNKTDSKAAMQDKISSFSRPS